MLASYALSAAGRTTWDDKIRTLGRSLASGLLAEDDAEIDVEQTIITAITDFEGRCNLMCSPSQVDRMGAR